MNTTSATAQLSATSRDHGKIKKKDLRKGTRSCWECKRRKMKCVFQTASHTAICQSCRRRGTPCIGQDIPEEVAMNMVKTGGLGDTVGRGANLSISSTSLTGGATSKIAGRRGHRPSTPMSALSLFSPQHSPAAPFEHNITNAPAAEQKHAKLSQFLHASLPSLEDTKRIYQAKPSPSVPAHELMTMPYTSLFQSDLESSANILEIPDSNWHPVLIARHMLMLASSLQHLHPDVHLAVKGLSETPRVMSERLAGLANHCVTSKDEMLGSIELLECIMIESVYQANLGNLRRSWVAARRALSVAQLMGIHRSDRLAHYEILDPTRTHDSRVMWSRIVFLDCFLCIMLGLPAGCTDIGITSDELLQSDLPTGRRLEQIHCIVAAGILERGGSNPTSHDLYLTRELDLELQKAARTLPAKWWLSPKLDVARTDPQALFWNTGRLFAQVLHHNLLNQLHLPFMLRSTPSDGTFERSRITCVTSSREILTRFIALRSFNGIASSCRLIDFITLMAALTLLLVHMDSSTLGAGNFLAHQYYSDRAMIEQVQESMEEGDRFRSDPLGAQSANLLRQLMTIDTGDIEELPQAARRVSVHPETEDTGHDDKATVSVHIPYFGIIKISNSPALNMSVQKPGSSEGDRTRRHQETASVAVDAASAESSNQISDPVLPHDGYPGLTAELEDWAFQGVDLAFFDSVMRSINDDSGGAAQIDLSSTET